MAARPTLEDFAPPEPPEPTPAEDPALGEADRLAAYERGYQAGWDDAAAADSADQGRIGADLARNLQDLSFTFHEARLDITRALEPLLLEIVAGLLPSLERTALLSVLRDSLPGMLDAARDVPLELVVAPQSRAAVDRLLAQAETPDLTVREEPSLAEGQAYLRAGTAERQIDVTSAIARIEDAVSGYFQDQERNKAHG